MRTWSSLTMLAVATVACSHPVAPPSAPPTSSPRDVIDAYVAEQLARHHVPGMSIAVVRDDKIIKAAAYGLAVVEHNVPATTDTLFQLDSTNKLLTAVATMLLERDGGLRLDDPIAKYLPGAPAAWSGITIQHLLSHTSGIRDEYAPSFHGSMLVDYDTAYLLSYALSQPQEHRAGEVSQYNNLGFFLLTQIVEKAAGMPYRRFMETRVLAPAGMTRSSYAEPAAIVPHLADSYAIRDGELVHLRDYMVSHAGESYALKSTAGDLARFHLALAAGRLIDAAALERMRERPRLLDGTRGTYGLAFEEGLLRGWPFYSKGGRSGAVYVAYPHHRLAVVVLGNLDGDTGQVSYREIANDIAGLVEPALAGPTSSPGAEAAAKGAAVLELLRATFDGKADAKRINLHWFQSLPPASVPFLHAQLASIASLVELGCDDVHEPAWEDQGMVVARTCDYRAQTSTGETHHLFVEWAAAGTLVNVTGN